MVAWYHPEQQIDGEVDGVLAAETPVEVDQPGCGRGKGHGQKKDFRTS